jgi:hypothetical protein
MCYDLMRQQFALHLQALVLTCGNPSAPYVLENRQLGSDPRAVLTESPVDPTANTKYDARNNSLVLFDRGDEIAVQASEEGNNIATGAWSTFSMMLRLSDSTTSSWSELRLFRRPRTRCISLRRTTSKCSRNEAIVPETSE